MQIAHATVAAGIVARPVGIIGGMGPAAAIDLARHFLEACAGHIARRDGAVCDQAFPEHWIAQLPAPDRSGALARVGDDGPLRCMVQALRRFADMGIGVAAVACNTAHAWHGRLQATQPSLELLHVAREVARHLRADGVDRVVLLATTGTYQLGLYDEAMRSQRIGCDSPPEVVRRLVMQGVYDGVKSGDMALARRCFAEAIDRTRSVWGDVPLVLGCTEIPLALDYAGGGRLINPNEVLANALADRAFAVTHAHSLSHLQEVFP